MRRIFLLSVLLASVSLSALAASSPEELKSRLAAARTEAASAPEPAPALPPVAATPVNSTAAPARQLLAEVHDGTSIPAVSQPVMDNPISSNTLLANPSVPSPLADKSAAKVVPALPSPVSPPVAMAAPPKAVLPTPDKTRLKNADGSDLLPMPQTPPPLERQVMSDTLVPATPMKTELYAMRPTGNVAAVMPMDMSGNTGTSVRPANAVKAMNNPAAAPVLAPMAAPAIANAPVPAAMPAPVVKTKPVSRPAANTQIAMAAPAPRFAPQPAPPVMMAVPAGAPVAFQPPAAAARGAWKTRTISGGSPDENFCLMENRFDNDTTLMIAQRPDGYSTLGVNYGIDMLRPGKPYQVSVQVDSSFDETFMGYAESGRTLVVQLGKKPSFFLTLPNASALHVAMPGVASTFSTQGIAGHMGAFSSCMMKIGGTMPTSTQIAPMTAQMNAPAVPASPVATQELGTVLSPAVTAAPKRPAAIAPQPVITSPAPVTTMSAQADTLSKPVPLSPELLGINMNETRTAGSVMPAIAPPMAPTARPLAPVNTTPGWSQKMAGIIRQAGIQPYGLQQNPSVTEWTDANGLVHGQVWHAKGADLIDAATFEIDRAEKNCSGTFTSQMGLPEEMGRLSTLQMESKCVYQDAVTVSAWFLTSENGEINAWEIQTPRDQRDQVFAARAQLLDVIRNNSLKGR